MPIEHISDTARWVAVYRAMESERPDALFLDPHARRLAGPRGHAIVNTLRSGRSMAWAMIVRTAVFDEIILSMLVRDRVGVVVNLAAGLDTRAWRLGLPSTLEWVDVDLPEILAYKTGQMRDVRPACAYRAVPADLTDAAARARLFAQLRQSSRRTLVVSEGLLIYLTAAQVGELAADLHAQPAFSAWVTDLVSPTLLRWMSGSWGRSVASANAPFRFAPANGADFFRPFGWRATQFRSSMEESQRLSREMRLAWLVRLAARLSSAKRREEFRRLSGIVLLERM